MTTLSLASMPGVDAAGQIVAWRAHGGARDVGEADLEIEARP